MILIGCRKDEIKEILPVIAHFYNRLIRELVSSHVYHNLVDNSLCLNCSHCNIVSYLSIPLLKFTRFRLFGVTKILASTSRNFAQFYDVCPREMLSTWPDFAENVFPRNVKTLSFTALVIPQFSIRPSYLTAITHCYAQLLYLHQRRLRYLITDETCVM